MFDLKYSFAFLGSFPRWEFWSFGHIEAGLEAPESDVEQCLQCARHWQPLPGWDIGSRDEGVEADSCLARARPNLPRPSHTCISKCLKTSVFPVSHTGSVHLWDIYIF